ncbi:CASP2 [Bugula neritina]|uniref:CASP2 n=1 Tax=Bugula neritina TaxID=10212 RepID=A0A7J7JLH6_BUGNE|nr:CASP2 [Bugula neritina]
MRYFSKSLLVVYKMSETARGRALIINNNVFPKRPELFREGSAVDVSNIRAVLAHLNFEVDVRRERTAKEMLKDIQDETENPDNEDYGMHVTVLMSHGGTFGAHGVLYGSDVKPVSFSMSLICCLPTTSSTWLGNLKW